MERVFQSKRAAKTMAILCMVCSNIIFIGLESIHGQVKQENEIRKAVFDTAYKYSLLVREPKGHGMENKHWAITLFNKHAHKPPTASYCSSFGMYCWWCNGITFEGVNALAYSWRNPKRLVWHRGFLALDKSLWPRLKLMQAVVCTISHVEFVAPISLDTYIVIYTEYGLTTIAGNTRGGKNRQEGVYYPIRRPWSFISGIYDHYTPIEKH